jgi:hypothetical protein
VGRGARQILNRIHEIGVRISIDDFGVGYSSLGYLSKLPVDRLKVDKSFVVNMAYEEGNAAIVRSIIDLAHIGNVTEKDALFGLRGARPSPGSPRLPRLHWATSTASLARRAAGSMRLRNAVAATAARLPAE